MSKFFFPTASFWCFLFILVSVHYKTLDAELTLIILTGSDHSDVLLCLKRIQIQVMCPVCCLFPHSSDLVSLLVTLCHIAVIPLNNDIQHIQEGGTPPR